MIENSESEVNNADARNNSMTRKRKSKLESVRSFFKIENGYAICCEPECGSKLSNITNPNMKRHLQLLHSEKAIANGWLANDELTPNKKKKYSIEIDKNEFKLNLAKLITEDAEPFSLLTKPSFKNIIAPMCQTLQLTVNEMTVKKSVQQIANQYKNVIREELKDRLISIKIDAATRCSRSLLGVNVQFCKDFKIHIRTLAMCEIFEKHTAEHLKSLLRDILNDYNIKIGQIYTITTDNGANMLKLVDLLDKDIEDDELNTNQTIPNSELEEFIEEGIVLGDDTWSITSIKCAAHTLQLCVTDAMKHFQFKSHLNKLRTIVKELKKRPYRQEFMENKRKIPPLDTITRWSSTFKMVEVTLQNKDFITQILRKYNNSFVNEFTAIMDKLQNIHDVLKPIAVSTSKLQDEQLVIGDMYKMILEIELELSEIDDNPFKTYLLERICIRKKKLLDSNAVISALYLDPRFNFFQSDFMTEEQKITAKVLIDKFKVSIKSNNFYSNFLGTLK